MGSLPNMLVTLEIIEKCRWKSKMDKVGGFCQALFGDRANECWEFMPARERIFRPTMINFGCSNATPIF